MILLDAMRSKINAAAGPFVCLPRNCQGQLSRFLAAHRQVRRAIENDDGSTLIEFSATLSVLMTFVYVLMQISMLLYTYGMISECAREASRYASVRGSTCQTSSSTSCTATTTSVSSYATGRGFPNLGGSVLSATTTYPDGNEAPGSRVRVQITYPYSVSLPLVQKRTISLEVASEMYIVQ
jgi:Flp pilus assembly protein TadG